MVKFWVEAELKGLKILKRDIRHAEQCGQGNVVQKKKRHLLELIHKCELSKAKREKTIKKDLMKDA